MNKKILKILLFNLTALLVILSVCELFIYKKYSDSFAERTGFIWPREKFGYYTIKQSRINLVPDNNFFNGADLLQSGRLPDGLEYSDKPSIIVFGCSFAFGQHLEANQTFSRKLSESLQRPVYNRAVSGSSLQHMYMQSASDYLYEKVKNPDTVIYVMIGDHYRRMLVNYFDILSRYINPHFTVKNNHLVMDNYKNIVWETLKSLYTVKYLNHAYVKQYIENPDNADKLTDTALLYFTETKKELEKRYNKKLNFYVFFYDNFGLPYKELLKEKLEKNGFKALAASEITDKDLSSEEYNLKGDNHPKEAAWDLLTPLIIEKFEMK